MLRTLFLGLALVSGSVHAASLSELFKSVPPPPANSATAGQWQPQHKIVAPAYTGFEAKLAAEKQANEKAVLAAGTANAAGLSPDMARAANDPAYAAQLQKKLQSMTPQEQMAFAMQMQAGMQKDGLAAVQDPPQVLAAIDAYNAYVQGTLKEVPTVTLGKRTEAIRARFEAQHAAMSKKLKYCDVGCTDIDGTEANNREVWKQKRAISDQELQAWAALFREWQAARAPVIAKGERDLAAVSLSKSNTNKSTLAMYHGAMLSEIELLLSVTRDATNRAASIERGARANAALSVAY